MDSIPQQASSGVLDSFERQQPHDLDAEQCVLGGLLLVTWNSEILLDVVEHFDGMDDDAFYIPAHNTIFEAILTLAANRQPIDPIAVADYLDKAGSLERIGGRPYLHTLVNATPTAANAEYYAGIVAEKARLRRVAEAGTRLVQMAYNPHTDGADILETVASELQALVGANTKAAPRELGLGAVLDQTLLEYDNPQMGLPLPWADMETALSITPGDFIVFAARPSIGKSTATLDIARHVAIRHNMPVLVNSMEMSHVQIGQRILSAEARVPLHHITRREMTEDDRQRVVAATERIRRSPLRIDDTPAMPLGKIRARLRQLASRGELPAVLIVDYIQIMRAEAKSGGNRTNEVDGLARGLKEIAAEFRIVVISAAQLNRKVEDRTDKTPQMSDLRESGAIEQDANAVILLHRPDFYEKESERAGEADFIIAKNRQGITTTCTVAFQGHYSRFIDFPRNV